MQIEAVCSGRRGVKLRKAKNWSQGSLGGSGQYRVRLAEEVSGEATDKERYQSANSKRGSSYRDPCSPTQHDLLVLGALCLGKTSGISNGEHAKHPSA